MTTSPTGKLYGVGVGPGDPELITLKAVKAIAAADVIAYHAAKPGSSIARTIAAEHFPESVIEEELRYPVTTGQPDHPDGYRAALSDFYSTAANRLRAHLDVGRTVVVISEGDPFTYGSYQHMHRRLADRYPTTVIPGVTSFAAAAAALGTPLVENNQTLTVIPGTLPTTQLTHHLGNTDGAVVMKLGRNVAAVRAALRDVGKLADTQYAERVGHAEQRLGALPDIADDTVPYMALALHPAPAPNQPDHTIDLTTKQPQTGCSTPQANAPSAPATHHATPHPEAAGRAIEPARQQSGEVVVVGLGPGDDQWLTDAAIYELRQAEHVIGYTSYMQRVPIRPGQHRHASDNTDEETRAHHALQLAAAGDRVVVVSSGDPGVFAMATAVVEAGQCDLWRHVPVRVEPGVTAAQALAARVGAPLGHDYAVLSLSDRLKPWSVIEDRLAACGAADLTVALYNPASRNRTHQFNQAMKILSHHRTPDTVVVVGRSIGRVGEETQITTLADVTKLTITMAHLVIVGSSHTYSYAGPNDSTRVWTSRRYAPNNPR